MNTGTPSPSINQLAAVFSPLYSYKLPPWWKTPQGIAIIAGCLLLLILGAGAIAWYRWWYKPPLTLAQWRAQELKALSMLLAKNHIDHRRFFGATTFFLKQFLVKLYGWQVLDKTDDELWDFIQHTEGVPASLYPMIQELLSYAQLAKFADAQVIQEKAEEAGRHIDMITAILLKENEKKEHGK